MNHKPCPLEAPPVMLDCPRGCGFSVPARFRYRLQVHLMVNACRNHPKTAVR